MGYALECPVMFLSSAWTALVAGLLLSASSQGNPQHRASNSESEADVTGTWQGRVETLVVDNFQDGTSRKRLFLHTSTEALELEGTGSAALPAGQMVEVTGRSSSKKL